MNQQPPQTEQIKTPRKPRDWSNLIFFGICIIVVLILYGTTITGSFVFDDREILKHQEMLSDIHSLDDVALFPYWTESAGLYRPATLVSYAFNAILFGISPISFHVINLLLYALTGFLLYLLIKKLSNNKDLAYIASIIFLIMPIHSEVVGNIIGRAEIFALLFSLLVLLSLLKRYPISEKIKMHRYWPIFFWIFLAIGSKEVAIAIVPIAVLMIYGREKSFWSKETFKKYLPASVWMGLGLFSYFILRLVVLGPQHFLGVETSIVENPLKFTSSGGRITTALSIITEYFKKSFIPIDLCSDYSYNQIPILHNFFNIGTILGAIIVISSAVLTIIYIRKKPIISIASAFFFFGFLPTSNIVFATGTIMGERLAYFPSVGLSILFGYLIFRALRKLKKSHLLYLLLILVTICTIWYSAISYSRGKVWKSERTLFKSAAECSPESVLSVSNLGSIYYIEGDLLKAKETLIRARSIYNGYTKGVNNLGLVYWKEGDNKKARELFLEALSGEFPYPGAYENLALVSIQEGKLDEARSWLLKLYSGDIVAVEKYIQNVIGQI